VNVNDYYPLQPDYKSRHTPTWAKIGGTEIRSDTGFSGVKNGQNRKIAWRAAWENTNIAINAGK